MNLLQVNWLLEHAALHVGFDWTEVKRVDDLRAAHPTWDIRAPMIDAPRLGKCAIIAEVERVFGLERPLLYRLGFPHNNCGGRCVRAGISHWVHLLKVLPDRYAEWEREEQDTMRMLEGEGIQWLTMLKDRRGGQVSSLSLAQLRARVESGEDFPSDDWGGCGCGGAENAGGQRPPASGGTSAPPCSAIQSEGDRT